MVLAALQPDPPAQAHRAGLVPVYSTRMVGEPAGGRGSRERLPVQAGERGKLGRVDPALAAFHLRHERLPPAEVLCDLALCEPGILTGGPQPRQHEAVLGCVDGLHGAGADGVGAGGAGARRRVSAWEARTANETILRRAPGRERERIKPMAAARPRRTRAACGTAGRTAGGLPRPPGARPTRTWRETTGGGQGQPPPAPASCGRPPSPGAGALGSAGSRPSRSGSQDAPPSDGLDLAGGAEVAQEGVLGAAERHEQPRQHRHGGEAPAALVGRERSLGDAGGAGELALRLAPLEAQAPDGTAELAGDALVSRHRPPPPTRRLEVP
jgi:hypothetical protein